MIYITTRPELFSSQLIHSDISSELYHHGIKGQKWGIRRYQNPDGSLTEEGKLRYNRALNQVATGPARIKKGAIGSAILGAGISGGLAGINAISSLGAISAALGGPVPLMPAVGYVLTRAIGPAVTSAALSAATGAWLNSTEYHSGKRFIESIERNRHVIHKQAKTVKKIEDSLTKDGYSKKEIAEVVSLHKQDPETYTLHNIYKWLEMSGNDRGHTEQNPYKN